LSLTEGHETIVWAIQGLVPCLIPRKLIIYVRVDTQVVFLDNLHTASVLQLFLEGFVHLSCALGGGRIPSFSLHLCGVTQSLNGKRVVLQAVLDTETVLLVGMEP